MVVNPQWFDNAVGDPGIWTSAFNQNAYLRTNKDCGFITFSCQDIKGADADAQIMCFKPVRTRLYVVIRCKCTDQGHLTRGQLLFPFGEHDRKMVPRLTT